MDALKFLEELIELKKSLRDSCECDNCKPENSKEREELQKSFLDKSEVKEYYKFIEWAFGEFDEDDSLSLKDIPKLWKKKHPELPELPWITGSNVNFQGIVLVAFFTASQHYLKSKI